MKTRKILAAAVILPLVAGVTTADAATRKRKPPVKKPVCLLVKDAPDDANDGPGDVPGVNDSNLDILSADVATNATTIAVAIRLKTLGASPDTSPAGRAFDMSFTVGTVNYNLRGLVGVSGNRWVDGRGSGIVDTAKKEIRMWAPMSAFSAKIPPGAKITNLTASTWRWVDTTNVVVGRADGASSAATYTAAWPSCLPVGS